MAAKKIDKSLKRYVEDEVIPRYASFDLAHREDHARSVISAALELSEHYDVDADMVYAAAAFHDTGLVEGRETHHLTSGRIIRKDPFLAGFFSPEQVETIAQAAEDHRASNGVEPRSIYGRIIAEADRDIIPLKILRRTVQFGFEHYPELDREGHWRRFLDHMHEKYDYGARLEELRTMISDLPRLRETFERIFDEETNQINHKS